MALDQSALHKNARQPKEHINCPSCKKSMPLYENEARWCQHCEWNLAPEENTAKPDLYTRIYRQLGKKLSQELFQSFIKEKVSRPRLTASKILAYLVAGFIHSLTILMLPSVFFAFKTLETPIAIFASTIFLGIAWVTCPKPRRWPKDIVPRNKAPNLYKLLDRIADEMGTSRVSGLIVDEEFNAFYNEYGFGKWKKKVIGVGVPLCESLNDEELVAVLAHETSHGANGDIARGVFIGTALSALANWYYIFTPRHFDEGNDGRSNISVVIANYFGAVVGLLPWLGYHILLRLLLRQTQECEYIADRLATEVCGTEPAVSFLGAITHTTPFVNSVAKAALSNGSIDLFEELKTRYQLPQSEHDQERIRRLEMRYGLSLDNTHPPAAYRIEFLRSTSSFQPKVRIGAGDSLAIRNELSQFKKDAARKLVDQYLSAIY